MAKYAHAIAVADADGLGCGTRPISLQHEHVINESSSWGGWLLGHLKRKQFLQIRKPSAKLWPP